MPHLLQPNTPTPPTAGGQGVSRLALPQISCSYIPLAEPELRWDPGKKEAWELQASSLYITRREWMEVGMDTQNQDTGSHLGEARAFTIHLFNQ